jgi:predicted acyl esterase
MFRAKRKQVRHTGPDRLTVAATATALVAALLAAPASARQFTPEVQAYIVDTDPGKVYVEVAHPTRNGNIVRAPAILTYTPFGALGRNEDAERWVEKGYARITADVVGTGNSGGCFDYGGRAERTSVRQLVQWIARQPWSNGKIGMYGESYAGSTAIAAAVERPRGLAAIVPVNAPSSWYDYNYSGGIRYSFNNEVLGAQKKGVMPALNENAAQSPIMFEGLAIPPPLDPHNDDWAERVQSSMQPCNRAEHNQRSYDDTPDYDGFWRQRDYARAAGRIRVPALVAHNWGNWNVKPDHPWDVFRRARNSRQRMLYMGSRWDGHTSPGGAENAEDFAKLVEDWFDHHLKGRSNRVPRLPAVLSQGANYDGKLDWQRGVPRVRNVVLYAQEVPPLEIGDYRWKLMPDPPMLIPGFDEPSEAMFPSVSANLESHANHHPRENHEWLWFEAPHFARNVRIFGEVKVQFYSTVEREWVTLTPGIVDVDPRDHVMVRGNHVANQQGNGWLSITRGFLDSRYRDSLAEQKPLRPGRAFRATVTTKPIDYTFKHHSYLGLNVSTEVLEWMMPKPYPCDPTDPECVDFRINWEEGRFRLVVPVVDAPRNVRALFDFDARHDH